MVTKTAARRKLDLKQVEKTLDETLTNFVCPFSGHNTWTIAKELVTVVPHKSHALVMGNSYPAVMIACTGCGYMALFSAKILGLYDEEDAGEEDE